MVIKKLVNKYLKQVNLKINRSGNGNGSGGGSSDRQDVTFHKCDKKGYTKR